MNLSVQNEGGGRKQQRHRWYRNIFRTQFIKGHLFGIKINKTKLIVIFDFAEKELKIENNQTIFFQNVQQALSCFCTAVTDRKFY